MDKEKLAIRKNIRILALDNLINTYTDALEDKELNLESDERELAMARIKDINSKEFKAAAKAYEDFKKKVLKPEQVA